jgi:hypothetical protein
MQGQRTQPSPRTSSRVARRYRTCAEALRAVAELELLAEDEVSHLRELGREAEADQRADAWNREIARALGEAEALRLAVANRRQAVALTSTRPRQSTARRYAGLWGRSPVRALAATTIALLGIVGLAHLIDAFAPEFLTLGVLVLALTRLAEAGDRRRRRRRNGR